MHFFIGFLVISRQKKSQAKQTTKISFLLTLDNFENFVVLIELKQEFYGRKHGTSRFRKKRCGKV